MSDAPSARLAEVLADCGVRNPHCAGLIALAGDDAVNQAIAIGARVLNPDLPIVTRAKSRDAELNLEAFEGVHVINPFETFAENLRLMIGEDSDDDGEVDRYRDSADPDTDWDRVQAMEIHMLVRSLDQTPGAPDERTYNLGNDALTPGGPFRRTVVSGVVSVRNAKLLIRGNI